MSWTLAVQKPPYSASHAAREGVGEPVQAKPKILVVDDNAENRALAQATLEDEGYDVAVAANGEDGLHAIEASQPDCVLLDVRMPGMDGFAVCDRIRAMPYGSEIPVVFLTALRDLDTFDRAQRVGGDDFLTKPVRPAELVVRVHTALKLRRMSVDLREHYDLVRRQRDDLMRLQLQKEQLTAFVIHDLKNPVNVMDLHAQLLLSDAELSQSARTSVECIREQTRSLLRMLLVLLDISKSEAGQLIPQYGDIDAAVLVAEVVETLELKARAAGVTLQYTIEAPDKLRADPDLLRRVIENLIENAVRYAPKDTAVRISMALHETWLELRIADSGAGVPAEMREKVFERFVQLEHGQSLVPRTGHGLGLTFCKLVIEAHGGRIWIEDGVPGAVFCVRLPR